MTHIVSIIFFLIVIGVVLYLINRVVPMDGNIKLIINVLVVLVVIAWLLNMFGLLSWK